AYAKDFAVVFGPEGLRAYLEDRAHQALAAARSQSSAKDPRGELAAREAELDRERKELDRLRAEIERSRGEVERRRGEPRARVMAAGGGGAATAVGPPPTSEEMLITKPVGLQEHEPAPTKRLPVPKNGTAKHPMLQVEVEDEVTTYAAIPTGADPMT